VDIKRGCGVTLWSSLEMPALLAISMALGRAEYLVPRRYYRFGGGRPPMESVGRDSEWRAVFPNCTMPSRVGEPLLPSQTQIVMSDWYCRKVCFRMEAQDEIIPTSAGQRVGARKSGAKSCASCSRCRRMEQPYCEKCRQRRASR
jgi:hypothetical protein